MCKDIDSTVDASGSLELTVAHKHRSNVYWSEQGPTVGQREVPQLRSAKHSICCGSRPDILRQPIPSLALKLTKEHLCRQLTCEPSHPILEPEHPSEKRTVARVLNCSPGHTGSKEAPGQRGMSKCSEARGSCGRSTASEPHGQLCLTPRRPSV